MNTTNSNSLFGSKTPTSTFGTFGNTATTQPSSLFPQTNNTFGSTSAPVQTGFGFGTSNSSVFGASPAVTSSGFSFGTANKSGFGATSSQPTTLGFNTNTSASPFGSTTTPGLFNSNAQTAQNPVCQNEYDLFISSISQPSLCGDDRDVIISRWNQLQAMWGSGTGLSSHGKSIYTPENFLCRFKVTSFNQIPNCEDSDGFVSLLIKSPFKDVLAQKIQIHEKLHQLLNSQIHSIVIEDIRPAIKPFHENLPAAQPKTSFGFPQPTPINQVSSVETTVEYTDVFIKVNETVNGITRLVPASTIAAQFKSEPYKSKLESELWVIDVVAQVSPNSKEINDYLNGPAPRGLDVEMWEKAKQHCNNSRGLVPVPVIGMVELKARIRGQIEFAQAQLATIRNEAETISEMKTKVISMSGKIDQLKRKEIELSNRILKILCTQEILSKQGYTLSAEEETLKCSLDKLYNQIVGPFGIKSRLQEILSAPKTATNNSKMNSRLSYNNLSNEAMEELKEYFVERQKSIKEMMTLIREDVACLNIIENCNY